MRDRKSAHLKFLILMKLIENKRLVKYIVYCLFAHQQKKNAVFIRINSFRLPFVNHCPPDNPRHRRYILIEQNHAI